MGGVTEVSKATPEGPFNSLPSTRFGVAVVSSLLAWPNTRVGLGFKVTGDWAHATEVAQTEVAMQNAVATKEGLM